MRPSFYVSLYSFAVIFLLAISCRKESGTKEAPLELLTGRKWQLTNLYHQEVGDNTVSDFSSIHYTACESDDSYHFTKSGQFFRRDSSNICATPPHFGLYGSAGWSADSSFTKISFNSFPEYAYNMEIKTLTKSTLELNHRVVDYFQKNIIYTYRFRALP